MKRLIPVVGVVLLAALVMLPAGAQAEMYVEAYLGGNFAANAPNSFSAHSTNPVFWTYDYKGHIDPAFLGGLKLGAWFERSGVLSGVNFPSWMKYLGFYLDFCYHNLNFPRRNAGDFRFPGQAVPFITVPYEFSSEGGAATLAFMFAFRYGFLPDQEVPFGRLQPYVAVGPAILFSWQQPTMVIAPGVGALTEKFESQSSTDIALAVEAGLRWMALKNVSLEVSFKWRHAKPSYRSSTFVATPGGVATDYLRFSPTLNLLSFQVGAAYHF